MFIGKVWDDFLTGLKCGDGCNLFFNESDSAMVCQEPSANLGVATESLPGASPDTRVRIRKTHLRMMMTVETSSILGNAVRVCLPYCEIMCDLGDDRVLFQKTREITRKTLKNKSCVNRPTSMIFCPMSAIDAWAIMPPPLAWRRMAITSPHTKTLATRAEGIMLVSGALRRAR